MYMLHERVWARIRWGLSEANRLVGGEGGPAPRI
jgi:uncharacterized membrane protein